MTLKADLADASVGGKDNYGCQAGLQRSVQICEALNVQHVHFINEEHAWYELCHSLVYVLIHHLQAFM